MSNILFHLERELRAAGLLSGTDPAEDKLVSDLRALVKTYAEQNHSGGTGTMTLQLFDRIANFKPLTPLTGDAREWAEVENMPGFFQNIRCTTVIKDDEGNFRDIGMKPVYVYPDGLTVTRQEPAPLISFPYMPGFPPVIAVNSEGNPIDGS
jgi:hypothetical protein